MRRAHRLGRSGSPVPGARAVEGGEWPGFPAPPAGPSGSETSKSDEDRAVFRLHRWDTLFSGNKTLYQIRQHLRLVVVHHVPSVCNLGDFYLRHVFEAFMVLG